MATRRRGRDRLLIGAERERRQAEEKTQHQAAGVRTFALTALLGGVLVQIDQPGVVVGGPIVITALALVAFGDHTDPGMTSEVALLLTFGLGALAQRQPRLALSAGVVTEAASRGSPFAAGDGPAGRWRGSSCGAVPETGAGMRTV